MSGPGAGVAPRAGGPLGWGDAALQRMRVLAQQGTSNSVRVEHTRHSSGMQHIPFYHPQTTPLFRQSTGCRAVSPSVCLNTKVCRGCLSLCHRLTACDMGRAWYGGYLCRELSSLCVCVVCWRFRMGRETEASHTHTNLRSTDSRSTTFSHRRTRSRRPACSCHRRAPRRCGTRVHTDFKHDGHNGACTRRRHRGHGRHDIYILGVERDNSRV